MQFVHAGEHITDVEINVSGGNTISISRLTATGNASLLWLPSEHGLTSEDKKIAGQLWKLGVDVWLVDLLNSYFLAPVASSIGKIPAQDISRLVNQFLGNENNKQQKIVLTSGRTATVLLQALKTSKRPDGVILISPNLYTSTPEPGSDATYLPIVSQTKQLIKILQPQLSPWFWQRKTQSRMLKSGGSKVSVKILPGVRDRFYFRPDAMESEKNLQETFPKLLLETINTIKQKVK